MTLGTKQLQLMKTKQINQMFILLDTLFISYYIRNQRNFNFKRRSNKKPNVAEMINTFFAHYFIENKFKDNEILYISSIGANQNISQAQLNLGVIYSE